MPRTILITGFDCFGGASVNPSWEAVKRLPDTVGDFRLYRLQIPTVFGKAADLVLEHAAGIDPDVVLCVGQAGGRDSVTPERIAVNIRDTRLRNVADNEGNLPGGDFVVSGGPAAFFSTLPVNEMAQAIRDAGIPGAVSNSAGTFVCNDTLYLLLHHYAGSNTRVGFVHVPWLPQQGSPSLPLEQITAALAACIKVF